MYTFNEIDFALRAFDALQSQQAVTVQPQPVDHETALERMLIIYRVIRPVLMGIEATVALFRPTWRAAIAAFIAASDVVVNLDPPPAAPVAAAAASADTTTTDPASTDPSFKAGKDL